MKSLSISRRRLLRGLFLTGSAAAVAPWISACGDDPGAPAPLGEGGELAIPPGPLSGVGPVGAPNSDGIAVPEGFTVRTIARAGLPPVLGSLYLWHTFPDGGATYVRANGGWIYTSNSEVPGGLGGAGALAFDPDGTVVDAYSILSGTSTNCAGGKTPWQTWLSCEEADTGRVWETDPFGIVAAQEKPALGTFAHEAAAVDLEKRIVYLTEDDSGGRFYRFVADASDLIDGGQRLALERGTLQVLNVEGFADGGFPEDADVRQLRRASWVDVVRPNEPQGTVRAQLEAAGQPVPGTRFSGGEGLWYYELPLAQRSVPPGGSVPTRGIVFWTAKGENRVWALDVENQLVETIFDNEQIEPDFDDVDNVTVSPWGDILVCEDYGGGDRPFRIIVVVPNQPPKVLVQANHPGSELVGPAFSPDGSRLYFSSQRGPNLVPLPFPPGFPGSGTGATYELTIPEAFRR
jgi:hypothetical protein